jgi:hypothetical protein
VVEPRDAEQDALVEQATVDPVPFRTAVLGVEVTVTKIDLLTGSGITAICSRGKHQQATGILDLPLPTPPPAGAEWIDAYRHWAPS